MLCRGVATDWYNWLISWMVAIEMCRKMKAVAITDQIWWWVRLENPERLSSCLLLDEARHLDPRVTDKLHHMKHIITLLSSIGWHKALHMILPSDRVIIVRHDDKVIELIRSIEWDVFHNDIVLRYQPILYIVSIDWCIELDIIGYIDLNIGDVTVLSSR